jgi:glutathione peroxidase-family protein
VVNTASKCGFTPQYKDLQSLYESYSSKGFVIIGFPANNFLNQEPGSNSDIRQFCTDKYQVTFPMMEKVSVKGKDIDPIYKWLTTKSENGVMDAPVSWNFQKFMIDENGNLPAWYRPKKAPNRTRSSTGSTVNSPDGILSASKAAGDTSFVGGVMGFRFLAGKPEADHSRFHGL